MFDVLMCCSTLVVGLSDGRGLVLRCPCCQRSSSRSLVVNASACTLYEEYDACMTFF